MAKIAVVHADLTSRGGGEAVCVNVVEALQDDHEVTLLTIATPPLAELNEYYNTNLRVEVEKAGILSPLLYTLFESLYPYTGVKFDLLQSALLVRYVNTRADEFDLIVSTCGDFDFSAQSIQYIHYPTRLRLCGGNPLRDVYNRVVTRYLNDQDTDLNRHRLLTNSQWTANLVTSEYGSSPTVVHPPVECEHLTDIRWSERENGFLLVGRIDPAKNVLEAINIIKEVRTEGHDIHLHIVGPVTHPEYFEAVQDAADKHDFIHIDGEVSRAELGNKISTHKYGLHARPNEHYGMVVAEFVAGGMIPFVPDSGGQTEIVPLQQLQFQSSTEAVNHICDVLDDVSLQATLRDMIRTNSGLMTVSEFQQQIADIVSSQLRHEHQHE